MKTQILEKLNDLKTRSGKSYEAVHEAFGYATSTVHRWHKGESEPDMEQLTNLVEFYGGSMTDLFAAVGKQEMTATQTIGYQGADSMVVQYEARLEGKDEKYNLLKEHHDQRLTEVNNQHEKAVAYLKKEIERLRGELDTANKAAVDLAAAVTALIQKKHKVFWVLVGANVLLAILLFVALKTGPIF